MWHTWTISWTLFQHDIPVPRNGRASNVNVERTHLQGHSVFLCLPSWANLHQLLTQKPNPSLALSPKSYSWGSTKVVWHWILWTEDLRKMSMGDSQCHRPRRLFAGGCQFSPKKTKSPKTKFHGNKPKNHRITVFSKARYEYLMYMTICIYIYIVIYIYTTYIHIYVYIHIYIYTCTNVSVFRFPARNQQFRGTRGAHWGHKLAPWASPPTHGLAERCGACGAGGFFVAKFGMVAWNKGKHQETWTRRWNLECEIQKISQISKNDQFFADLWIVSLIPKGERMSFYPSKIERCGWCFEIKFPTFRACVFHM